MDIAVGNGRGAGRCCARAAVLAVLVALVAACTAGTGGMAPASVSGTGTTAPAPSATPTVAPSPSTSTAALQARLDALRTTFDAPGAILLLQRAGRRTFLTSGAADLAGTSITADSRFRIASLTKPIVATLVLDAVARGQVALDDVVGDVLPGVLRPSPEVTVRQLLDHTSGIFDETNESDVAIDMELLTDPALKAEGQILVRRYNAGERVIVPGPLLVALAERHDRYFPPGAWYHYSNINYEVAAMVLEQVTGTDLADLLRERIVEPLGLERTTLAPTDRSTPDIRSYLTDTPEGTGVDMTDDLSLVGSGAAGGIISTPDELLTTISAVASGSLLPPELATEMRTPDRGSYGLGLAFYRFPCGSFYGHQGLVLGIRSFAVASTDGQDGVVVVLNRFDGRDPDLESFARRVLCPGS